MLQAAAGIFGVEARHAAIIGNLLNLTPEGGVYMGPNETAKTKSQVLAVAGPFIKTSSVAASTAAATVLVDTSSQPLEEALLILQRLNPILERHRMKSIVRVAILAMTLLMLAGCSRGSQSEPQAQQSDAPAEEAASAAGSSSDCEASESLEISAKDTTYDKECLAAPADEPFKVTFNNTDGSATVSRSTRKRAARSCSGAKYSADPKSWSMTFPL